MLWIQPLRIRADHLHAARIGEFDRRTAQRTGREIHHIGGNRLGIGHDRRTDFEQQAADARRISRHDGEIQPPFADRRGDRLLAQQMPPGVAFPHDHGERRGDLLPRLEAKQAFDAHLRFRQDDVLLIHAPGLDLRILQARSDAA